MKPGIELKHKPKLLNTCTTFHNKHQKVCIKQNGKEIVLENTETTI